ncbi:MAG: hypothetical protein HZA77_00005, partial [Candidatus Schekmanbacteria bacterium]|nr:hypothetical protein [Nitrospirota bacterium]MBI5373785.1 hypothetical protein [Candidatus Schekmanbacteria bacterium]
TIPSGISGNYYIIAKADADTANPVGPGTIGETNENNNAKYKTIKINP